MFKMMLHSVKTRRYIRRLVKVVVFVGFMILFFALILHFGSKPIQKSLMSGAPGSAQLGQITTSTDASTLGITDNYNVAPSSLPTTQADRQQAPADTLIPSDWAKDPNPSAYTGGPQSDVVRVPTNTRSQMMRVVDQFIRAWETFDKPNNISNQVNPYADSLQSYVDATDLADIAQRIGNHQPDYICPGCIVQSQMISTNEQLGNTERVRAYSGSTAYVTLDATVKYISSVDTTLNDTTWVRDYGVLLSFENGQWLITRVAADTIEQLS
jgi:hypothetical protein